MSPATKVERKPKKKNLKYYGDELSTIDTQEYEDLDKVVKNKGLSYYKELKYDEQIKFCLAIKKFLILAPGWEITPADDSPQAQEQADFVTNNINSLDKNFSVTLLEILSALDFGYSVSEENWEKADGNIYLKNIKSKFPWDCSFVYDDFGNVETLIVGEDEVPINKFVIYSYMQQFGNRAGESDLKAVYNAWWFKNIVWKFWARHLERFSSPIIKGHIPQGATQDQRKKFFGIINRLHHIAGVILPKTAQGEEFEFELVETKREGSGQFLEAIGNADSRIAAGLMIPRLFGVTKESFGSYALGLQQFNALFKFLSFVASGLADDVVNKQIIQRIIDYNFFPPLYPKFEFNDLNVELVDRRLDQASEIKEGYENIRKQQDTKMSEGMSVKGKELTRCPLCNAKVQYASEKGIYLVCANGHLWQKKKI